VTLKSRWFNLHCPVALLFELYGFRNSSGSLAIFAAIRRASGSSGGFDPNQTSD
jgi:hypothetical protein